MATFPHEHQTGRRRSRLEEARPDQIAEVYRESHSLWGAGLTLENYRGLWEDLHRTRWGKRNARFCVWTAGDGRHALSSVKLYRPRIRLGEQVGTATVLGAIFTPPALRGRGFASAMVEAVLAEVRDQGDLAALLFTDIGTSYYRSFGFRALPAREQWGVLWRPTSLDAAGWNLDEMRDDDLPAVMRAQRAQCDERRVAVLRDEDQWAFLRVRSDRFFERLADPDLRQRWIVARRSGRFAGYLITVEGRGEWNVREVGAVDGDADAMAKIVRLGAAEAWRAGLRGFYGWLPPSVAGRLRDLGIRSRSRTRAVPMILPTAPGSGRHVLGSPERDFVPFQDQF